MGMRHGIAVVLAMAVVILAGFQARTSRQFHVAGQPLPASAASPAALEGGSTATSVNVDYLILTNTDTSIHTVTVEDCAATPFTLFNGASIPATGTAGSTWVIPLGNMRFVNCFKWSASSTTVEGALTGTR